MKFPAIRGSYDASGAGKLTPCDQGPRTFRDPKCWTHLTLRQFVCEAGLHRNLLDFTANIRMEDYCNRLGLIQALPLALNPLNHKLLTPKHYKP